MKRILFSLSAAALAGSVLPVSASAPAATAAGEGFGYSSVVMAAPVMIEFYEPTIPIPADPQFEVEMAYTTVEADSGSSLGRASWFWPGDPVGEGAKTFGEQLGLPSQLFENGYPVQVNSGQPSGEERQADEPFPGTVMRTSASATRTIAQAGYSPDGQVHDGRGGSGQDGGDGGGGEGTPGVPTPPGAPELPGADLLSEFGDAITGGLSTSGASTGGTEPEEEPAPGGAPGVPPEVAALVDFEGYTSSSQNLVTKGAVSTISRAALGDVSLLGGLITLDGVVSTSTSSSDGTRNTATGRSVLGGMTVAGQEFSFGPSGYHAGPQQGDAPAIPDEAAAALKQLGVTLVLPKPQLRKKGDAASSSAAALRVEIDAGKLRKQLNALPIDDVISQFPNDPQELKSTLQAVAGLSPRIVITLAAATTEVQTVDAIEIPSYVPDNDPGPGSTGSGGDDGGPADQTSTGTASTGGGSAAPGSSSAPAASGGDAPTAAGDLPAAELAGSGLPPLYSIPGALLAGGLALGALGGTWLRRIGVIALGGAGSCSHGLDSGLPDLRKAP